MDVIESEMMAALRSDSRPAADADRIVEIAQSAGLKFVDRLTGTPKRYGVTPEKAAQRIEQRSRSALWDVDPDTWEAIVDPAIRKIRALPRPDEQLVGVTRARILVLER